MIRALVRAAACVAFLTMSLVARPAEAGILVLKNGKVLVGKIAQEDVTESGVTMRWPYKGDPRRGKLFVARSEVRWFDVEGDVLTADYWRAFPDAVLEPAYARPLQPRPAAASLVTIELRSGERLEGELLGLESGVYRVRAGGVVREVKEREVRRIDFGGEAPARVEEPEPAPIDLEVEDVDLRDAIAGISARVKRPIFVDPSVQGKVTVSLRQIPWRQAVEILCRMTRSELSDYGEGSLLVHQPPRVTVQLSHANLRTALQLISAYSGVSIVLAPGVRADVTLDLKEVPWYQAIDVLAKAHHLNLERRGRLVVVSDHPLGWGSTDLTYLESGKWPARVKEPSERLTLDLKEVSLEEACERIAGRVGKNVLASPDLGVKVTLALNDAPWRDAVSALARLSGAVVEDRDGIASLQPIPANTIRAFDAPLDALFPFLASAAGKNLVLTSDASAGAVTVDLTSVPWLDALTGIAAAHGIPVASDGADLLKVGSGQPREGKAPVAGKPRTREVLFPGGRRVSLALQALVVESGPTARPRAIIGGRVHVEGDALRGADDVEVPDLKVSAITRQHVTLEDTRTRAVANLEPPEAP